MKSLHEIIAQRGCTIAGRELGYSRNYIWMVLTGRRGVSGELLERAHDQYGEELDLKATVSRSKTARATEGSAA